MLYVLSTRGLVDMVEGAASFTVHVSKTMRSTWERAGKEELEEFDSGPIASMARIAADQIESNFPLFHGHTLVGLWGALEACIEDMCVSWLASSSSTAVAGYLSRVKVPLGEFLSRDGNDQWRWVLLQIESTKGSALKRGVGQFEIVLDDIGLGGEVADEVRDVLYFAKALRNLYAHQAGRADAKFIVECPGFNARAGERVPITREQLTAAFTAMVLYVETVFGRVGEALGGEPKGIGLPPWIESLAQLRQMALPAQ